MKEYRKHPAGRPAPAEQSRPADPLAGGMPSLTEGASRRDLPEAMRAKMENAFGADFSHLNIYESERVAEGGAKAVTQGNTIAFAPGEFNPYSPHSEALLGHELSHVVSQARGESRGSGLLDDSYLEAKADREGVMAAAGQQVYSGPVTPLSPSSPASVAGPMQCKRGSEPNPEDLERRQNIQADDAGMAARRQEQANLARQRRRRGDPEYIHNRPAFDYRPARGPFRGIRGAFRHLGDLLGLTNRPTVASPEVRRQQDDLLDRYNERRDIIDTTENLGGTYNPEVDELNTSFNSAGSVDDLDNVRGSGEVDGEDALNSLLDFPRLIPKKKK